MDHSLALKQVKWAYNTKKKKWCTIKEYYGHDRQSFSKTTGQEITI